MRADYSSYYEVLKVLREKMPPNLPVVVRRIKSQSKEGYCMKKDKKFHIRISVDLPESKAIDVLLHEWAHALVWTEKYDHLTMEQFKQQMHGREWGLAYSKVYQLFEKHFLEEDR